MKLSSTSPIDTHWLIIGFAKSIWNTLITSIYAESCRKLVMIWTITLCFLLRNVISGCLTIGYILVVKLLKELIDMTPEIQKQQAIRWFKRELRTLREMSAQEMSVSKNTVSPEMFKELEFFVKYAKYEIRKLK